MYSALARRKQKHNEVQKEKETASLMEESHEMHEEVARSSIEEDMPIYYAPTMQNKCIYLPLWLA